MRQYGAIAGNPWESDKWAVQASARAVENRRAGEEIAEGLEAVWLDFDTFECSCEECLQET